MDVRKATVCRDCLRALRQPKRMRIAAPIAQNTRNASTHSPPSSRPKRFTTTHQQQWTRRKSSETSLRGPAPAPAQSPDLNALHHRVQELSASILKHPKGEIPSEQRILYVLEQLDSIARAILDERGPEGTLKPKAKAVPSSSQQETATSALLGSVNARSYPAFISRASILNTIGESAEEIARHPHVFISPAVLKSYVELCAALHRPSSFPDIFALYATKPLPQAKGNEIIFSTASPDKINAAIDSHTANTALSSAISQHNLALAIDIITTSFSTPAFKKAKTLRQAAFPMAGLAAAPVAAYTLSGAFSSLQQTMDPSTATGIAFAGIMTYVGAVSMVGYVAVTTANDQMDRVTWASGVPLWERWIREEERAAIDRVAGAWGFKDVEQRGEEEGEEWEQLREWVGIRGMVLDRVSLMEGME